MLNRSRKIDGQHRIDPNGVIKNNDSSSYDGDHSAIGLIEGKIHRRNLSLDFHCQGGQVFISPFNSAQITEATFQSWWGKEGIWPLFKSSSKAWMWLRTSVCRQWLTGEAILLLKQMAGYPAVEIVSERFKGNEAVEIMRLGPISK